MIKEYEIKDAHNNYIIICNNKGNILNEYNNTQAFLDNKDALSSSEVDLIKEDVLNASDLILDPIFNLNVNESISNNKVTITRLK